MRLRKVKNLDKRLEANKELIIRNAESYKGMWKFFFGNDRPIHLEIGMGKGQFITTLAKNNPDVNYIGLEKEISCLIKASEKIEKRIPNLIFVHFDATNILDVFSENEIDKLYLNFSDPWPKARHAKRRLTYIANLEKYKVILNDPCDIEMKTDNIDLFEFSVESFKEAGFSVLEKSYDLHKDKQDIVTTEYEDKFTSLGNKINYIHVNYKEAKWTA